MTETARVTSRPAGVLETATALHGLKLGLGLATIAFFFFSCVDAGAKWLLDRYPMEQLIFSNSLIAAATLVAYAAATGQLAKLRARQPGIQLVRGLTVTLQASLAIYAYSHLPLLNFYVVLMIGPLLIAIASSLLLGERVGWWRGSLLALAAAGVLFIIDPWQMDFADASMLAYGAALALVVAGTGSVLLIRRFRHMDSSLTFAFYGLLGPVVVYALPALDSFVTPAATDLALMVGMGITLGLAKLAITSGYHAAPAPAVAPIAYTQLMWGTLFGWVLWQQLPDSGVLGGALLVVAATAIHFWHEARALRLGH